MVVVAAITSATFNPGRERAADHQVRRMLALYHPPTASRLGGSVGREAIYTPPCPSVPPPAGRSEPVAPRLSPEQICCLMVLHLEQPSRTREKGDRSCVL